LRGSGQRPDDHLGIDRVTRKDFPVLGFTDKAQIFGVLEVVVLTVSYLITQQDRLNGIPDTLFLETFEEVVEVHGSVPDKSLYSFVDEVESHGRAVITGEALLDHFASDGIDQPRLAERLFIDVVDGLLLKDLSRVGGMLAIESGDLLAGEVFEGHHLGDDIEGTHSPHGGRIGADMDAVIANVTQPHERYGMQERDTGVAADITVAELRDERDQERKGQPVDFVEKDNERLVQQAAIIGDSQMECGSMFRVPNPFGKTMGMRAVGETEHGFDCREQRTYPRCRFGDVAQGFHRAVKGIILAAGVEAADKVLYASGFTGLPGGMDEEILLGAYQLLYALKPFGGGYHVVFFGEAGAGDVEYAFHTSFLVFLQS
jgi:hypothetical protein